MVEKKQVIPLVLVLLAITRLVDASVYVKPVHSWWDSDHMIVTTMSIRLMPEPWRSFLGYYEFYLNETTVYPDTIYKHLDPEEESRHFIDLEIWNRRKPETGTFPFAVERFAGEAAQAMRGGDWNKALYDLGRISHYIADVHQPYHSTADYNPKSKTGKALHSLLDILIQAHYKEYRIVSAENVGALEPVQNLTAFCLQVAWQSNSFLKKVNQVLVDEERDWSPELSRIVENRTNSAVIAIARVWYSITANAGVVPPGISQQNRLTVSVAGIPKQLDVVKEATLRITVTDDNGIYTPAILRATLGSNLLSCYGRSYVADPLGKYVAPIPADVASQYGGSDVPLIITAERSGYVSARLEAIVRVEGAAQEVVQRIVIMSLAAGAAAIAGTAYLGRRRKKVLVGR